MIPYNRRPFDLLWNFRRQNRLHVYLVVGDGSLSEALSRFERTFKITATFVNLTPENSPVARLRHSINEHGCCVFYIRDRKPESMRSLRELLWERGYPEEILTMVNKVYRFHGSFDDQYALAA